MGDWSECEAGRTAGNGEDNERVRLTVEFESGDNLHQRIVFKDFLTSKTFSSRGTL